MKKTIIAILVLLSAVGASAQSLFWDGSDADKPVTIGARLGWNFASMAGKGSNLYDGRKGIAFGAEVDVNLIKSFSINTGLYFSMKGASREYEELVDDINGVKTKDMYTVNFLEIPVYASYHLRFAPDSDLQIFAGPYFGYGIYGKYSSKHRGHEGYDEGKVNVFGKNNEGFKRWQAGIGLGASYTFSDRYVVGMQYQWGVSDVGELMDNQWNLFQLSVGYNF